MYWEVGEDMDSIMTLVGVVQIPKGKVLVDPDGEEARDSAVFGR